MVNPGEIQSSRGGNEPADALLVGLAAAGDERACEQLVLRYSPVLIGFLHGRVRGSGDIEDIVQETFITAFRGLKGLRNAESFGPWLMRIAKNKLKDFYRSESRRPVIEMIPGGAGDENSATEKIPSSGEDPRRRARSAETRRLVLAALGEFPDKYRIILYLRIIGECEPHEIAARLNTKESTVRMRLKRGLEKLRSALVKRGIVSRNRS